MNDSQRRVAEMQTLWERPTIDDTYTPVSMPAGDIWVKHDDTYTFAGVNGGKVRTCVAMATVNPNPPTQGGLITAGAAHSPQVNIVAHVGAALGLPVRVHVPDRRNPTPELIDAARHGAVIIGHRPGYNSVIKARARNDAATRPGWVHIPFGMECWEAVQQTAYQTGNLPDCRRVVMAVGSGMSLAGILWGTQDRMLPMLGVTVGADPTKRLDTWAPAGWRDRVTLVDTDTPYNRPADITDWWGKTLDAHYEAKAAPYVTPGDCFWIVGLRSTQAVAI